MDAVLAPRHTLLQCNSRLADSLARFTAEMTSSKADSGGGRGFIVRCLNIMDPLLPSNNLGRSVVRSSFARIRRAFGHGATLVRGMALKVGVARRASGVGHTGGSGRWVLGHGRQAG